MDDKCEELGNRGKIMRNQHKVMAVLMAIGCFWGLQKLPVVAAASGAPVPVGTESGAQLSRLREYLEKERVARDIAAQREKRREDRKSVV